MFIVVSIVTWYSGNDLARRFQSDQASVSHGTTNSGYLEYGKRLPTAGPNFHSYSRLGALLGRTSVHGSVRTILLESFRQMERSRPGVEFIIGETGWPTGGPFPPHRTHENGSSVDLFVPVIDAAGRPASLPTWPWNKFGYSIEFDSTGRWHGHRIDFEALADHLLTLQQVADRQGAPITRVILDPRYADELGGSEVGRRALRSLPWMRGKPWVRHDEHYHVDFGVPGSRGLG